MQVGTFNGIAIVEEGENGIVIYLHDQKLKRVVDTGLPTAIDKHL